MTIWRTNDFQSLEGRELFDYIINMGNFSERIASKLVLDVADALRFLHAKGIVHRDISMSNFEIYLTSRTGKPYF